MVEHQTIEILAGAADNPMFSRWSLVEKPRAAVQLIHGLSEHGGRYEHVMHQLASWGISSVVADHRGHGRSAVHPGEVASLQDLVDDQRLIRAKLGERVGQVPVFVWGHSMGGLVAALYLCQEQSDFVGAILASAAIVVPRHVPRWLVASAPLLAKWVPRLGLLKRSSPALMCSDPTFIARTARDPLTNRSPLKVMTGTAILQAMSQVQKHLRSITLPTLVIHGTADQIVDLEASQVLYAGLGAKDKTLRLFAGFAHELHNDIRRDEVFKLIHAWLDARIGGHESQEYAC